jgi:hypothetical protein
LRNVPAEVLHQWREADAREAEALGHVGEAVDLLAPVRGGPTLENLRTRCAPCNARKGTR